MNSTLAIVLVIIVVLIGGYFLFFNNSPTPTPVVSNDTGVLPASDNPQINGSSTPPGAKMETGSTAEVPASKVTITYNGTSFSPKTVTIKQGESVTFINNSSGGMSVASNPHPTHTDYPEFDQFKSTQKGQKSYTFVFEKVGSWGYHNHLNPSSMGTVVVQ